ncbi:hypothetical protein GDO86_014441 [Hymenochirus boettgeri]|uniref:Uncharacterized protein n=1 Tax=Hymenochirus boettgeri TaxID=247094 RepID=A0A8T2JUM9_9PIPI|nr:hypothetical protein GDO86_014441 [Hymenochirus boettgeri]
MLRWPEHCLLHRPTRTTCIGNCHGTLDRARLLPSNQRDHLWNPMCRITDCSLTHLPSFQGLLLPSQCFFPLSPHMFAQQLG